MTQSSAAQYGNALTIELARHIALQRKKGGHVGEVLLFSALADAFATAKAPQVHSEVFHGTAHQVRFHIGVADRRCELCDLLIVAFSAQQPLDIRMTLLQAKFERRS